MIAIFDVDGTLSCAEHRLHYIQDGSPRKWDEFCMAAADDPPIKSVIAVCHALQDAGLTIWFWTGRSEISRDITMDWLEKYVDPSIRLDPDRLRMRPAVDHRHDDILKEHWLLNRTLEDDRERIMGVFEDRARVAEMWRRNGIRCFQVAPGLF